MRAHGVASVNYNGCELLQLLQLLLLHLLASHKAESEQSSGEPVTTSELDCLLNLSEDLL